MTCEQCGEKTRVRDTSRAGIYPVRRTHACPACGHTFRTEERFATDETALAAIVRHTLLTVEGELLDLRERLKRQKAH